MSTEGVAHDESKFVQHEPRDINENVDKEPIGDLDVRKKHWEELMLQSIEQQKSMPLKTTPKKFTVPIHYGVSTNKMSSKNSYNGYVSDKSHDNGNHDSGNYDENVIQREIRVQQHREMALKKDRENNVNVQYKETDANEPVQPLSALELEIKLQQERELENAHQRELVKQNSPISSSSFSPTEDIVSPLVTNSQKQLQLSMNGRDSTVVEGIIRREMEELQMRERELQKERKALRLSSPSSEASKQSDYLKKDVHVSHPKVTRRPSPPGHFNAHTNVTKRGRSISAPNTPLVTATSNDVTDLFEIHETAVEKEKRLSVGRDAEHRRLRGLSENTTPRTVQVEVRKSPVFNQNIDVPRKLSEDGGRLRSLASSRLQMEIEKEKKRELDLKREGKIRTISEEHIGEPANYVETVSRTKSLDGSELFGKPELVQRSESLIAQEIREQKRREKEIRELRERVNPQS